MRNILLFLTSAAALASSPALGATPAVAWSVSQYSTSGGALLPGGGDRKGPLAVADGEGNVAIVASDDRCLVVLKLAAPDGTTSWRREVCGDGATLAGAIALDARGDVIVTGALGGDVVTAKFDGLRGQPAWQQRLTGSHEGRIVGGSPTLEVGRSLAVDAQGDVRVLAAISGGDAIHVVRYRGADGALAWQRTLDTPAQDVPVAIAVDAAGAALVAARVGRGTGQDFRVVKLDAAGAIAWDALYDGGLGDAPAALALDGAGNAIVTGSSENAAGDFRVRTVKFAGATGAVLWTAEHGSGTLNGGAAVAATGGGEVTVGGFVSSGAGTDLVALRYGSDGGLRWQRAISGGAGLEAARSIAHDGGGDVLLTGVGRASDGAAEILTVELAAGDGAERWRASHRGSAAGADDTGLAVVPAPDGATVVGISTEAGRGASLRAIRYREAATAAGSFPPGKNVQGTWWQPSEPGWGLNIAHQGEKLFVTWFTYGADGQGRWLVMSDATRVGPQAWQGTVYESRGAAFSSTPYPTGANTLATVGQASLVFGEGDSGQFHFTLDGVSRSKAIVRHVFAGPVPVCSLGGPQASGTPNFQDLWWAAPAGSESGWGLNIAHQGDTLFVTWFTYGADGRDLWLVGSDIRRTGPTTFAGTLYRTAGASFAQEPWDARAFVAVPAGEATLTFEGAAAGRFEYTVDGLRGSKPIVRQVFATPASACR